MNKKSFALLVACLCMLFGGENPITRPVMAQTPASDPVISLTVKDEPLAEVLDAIAGQTGYTFNLSPEWEEHPVSATINNLPLEQGLKRLLRSLNHTILWESDAIVTIKVYGKAAPGQSGGVSFAQPPQEYREEREPPDEPADEPADEDRETDENGQGHQADSAPAAGDAADERTTGPGRSPQFE